MFGGMFFGDDIIVREALKEKVPMGLEQNEEINTVIGDGTSAKTIDFGDDTKWVDDLLADLENRPDKEEKEYIPRSISEFSSEIFSDAQLSEIQKGIDSKVNIDYYAKDFYSGRQMREIRFGLERGLDVTFYANKYYRAGQMKEIRRGLQDGLDVTGYARIMYSATDMKERRMYLYSQTVLPKIDELSYDYDEKRLGLHIYVEQGLMEAGIVLKKPLPRNFSKSDLKKLLKEYDIPFGFVEDELPSNLANLPLSVKIPVMLGKKAAKGRDGYYKLYLDIEKKSSPTIREDGSVEYTADHNYKMVKRGEVVAEYYSAEKGEDGCTVTGVTVAGIMGAEPVPIESEDLLLSRDKHHYLAKKDGFLCMENGKVTIRNELTYDEDISYLDGRISYDGDIRVKGSVINDANITATGDIIIDGLVGTAKIVAGKNVVIRGGVNGDNAVSVIAGGNITAGFFENAYVKAGGNVETNYALNSTVECEGMFQTKGAKSLVCGGSISAEGGMSVGIIGSRNKTQTLVCVGKEDNIVEQYMNLLRKKQSVQAESEKVDKVMQMMIAKLGALKARQNDSFSKLQVSINGYKDEIEKIEFQMKELDEERERRNKLFISVAKNVYEGTTVSINGNRLTLAQDSKGTTIMLDGGNVVLK